MSSLCLDYVFVQYMASICLQYQTFVLAKSNICPSDLTFVLSLSSQATKFDGKSSRQNLVNLWTLLFTPSSSGHPASGQNLDNLWTWRNPKFVHLFSMSNFPSTIYAYHSIPCLDKFWTNIGHMSNLCPPLGNPKKGLRPTTHGQPTAQTRPFKPTETNSDCLVG